VSAWIVDGPTSSLKHSRVGLPRLALLPEPTDPVRVGCPLQPAALRPADHLAPRITPACLGDELATYALREAPVLGHAHAAQPYTRSPEFSNRGMSPRSKAMPRTGALKTDV
jgi:hypothetical protein